MNHATAAGNAPAMSPSARRRLRLARMNAIVGEAGGKLRLLASTTPIFAEESADTSHMTGNPLILLADAIALARELEKEAVAIATDIGVAGFLDLEG